MRKTINVIWQHYHSYWTRNAALLLKAAFSLDLYIKYIIFYIKFIIHVLLERFKYYSAYLLQQGY